MRHAILVLAGLTALGGCSYAERNQVNATPPSVSYRVAGNDISQADASAQQYCERYNASAQYQGLRNTPSGNVAVYTCTGAVAASGSTTPPPPYASPEAGAAPLGCATPLHQDLPGGTDYYGPPVPGCTRPAY